MAAYATAAARILANPRYQTLIRRTRPGQRGCTSCGHVADVRDWRGHVCPECGTDGRRGGCLDGDDLATHLRTA